MAQTVFVEAINQALIEEMERDESVFIMGEDIRRAVYGATAELFDKFGEKRVLDTPLSEFTPKQLDIVLYGGKAGDAELLVVGGVEHMSNAAYLLPQYRWGGRLGHGQVSDDQIEGLTVAQFQALLTIFGFEDFIAFVFQDLF